MNTHSSVPCRQLLNEAQDKILELSETLGMVDAYAVLLNSSPDVHTLNGNQMAAFLFMAVQRQAALLNGLEAALQQAAKHL